MKKLLLSSAALAGLMMATAPAQAAEGVKLDLGGYFKGYGAFIDQDENLAAGAGDVREFDILRTTEVHLSGETTLDNGLTVGAHIEMEADQDEADGFQVEESYVYMSGGWGRVNFGAEDGAAFLLQVAAPSADTNVDGLRQLIHPVNYTAAGATALAGVGGYDYETNLSGAEDKLTYLTPIFSGFQAGVSYTPEMGDASTNVPVNLDDVNDDLGSIYEASLRYEGEFEGVGVTAGAGFVHAELERDTDAINNEDDRQAWNVGLDLDIGPFGIGAAYTEDNYAENVSNSTDDDEQTFVVGVDYTVGAFKLGASYFDQENTGDVAGFSGSGVDTQRYTGGVVYTYGPGMTFRGSVSYIEHENVNVAGATTAQDVEATSVLIGTQVKF